MENKIDDLEFVFGYNREIHQYQVLHCKDCPFFSGVECHGHGEFFGSCTMLNNALKVLSTLFKHDSLFITERDCLYLYPNSICPFFYFMSFAKTPLSIDYKVKLAESLEDRKQRIYCDIFDRFFKIGKYANKDLPSVSMKDLVERSKFGLVDIDR